MSIWKKPDTEAHGSKPEQRILESLVEFRKRYNSDLREVASRFLHELRVPSPNSNEYLTGLDLVRLRHGDFSLIGTKLMTPTAAARSFYAASTPRDTFIADAAFTARVRGGDSSPAIGNPISRLLAEYHLDATDEGPDAKTIDREVKSLAIGLVNVAQGVRSQAGAAESKEQAKLLEGLLKHITPALTKKLYAESKKLANSRGPIEGLPDNGLALYTLQFPRMQRIFTHLLLTRELAKGKPTLKEVILSFGNGAVKDLRVTGAWQDPEVLEKIAAADKDIDPGAKQLRVESFIRQIPELAEDAVAECGNCSTSERAELIRIAKAFTALCIETYVQRVKDERVEDTTEGRKKAGAKISASLRDSFAEAYQTLFKMGLVWPLPVQLEAPDTSPSEEEASRRAAKEKEAFEKFREERLKELLKQLRDLRAKLSTGEELRGNFAGTLAFAMATRSTPLAKRKELLSAKKEAVEAEERAAATEQRLVARKSEPYMVISNGTLLKPTETPRTLLEASREKVANAEAVLDIEELTDPTSKSSSVGWKSSLTDDVANILARIQSGASADDVQKSLDAIKEHLSRALVLLKEADGPLRDFSAMFKDAEPKKRALAEESLLWYRNRAALARERFNVLRDQYLTAVAHSYIGEALEHLKQEEREDGLSAEQKKALQTLIREIEGGGKNEMALTAFPVVSQLPRYKHILRMVYGPAEVDNLFTL